MKKGLRMTVVKNTLAKRAVGDGKLKGFDKLLDGPSAVIYGSRSGSRSSPALLLDEKKNDETLELRGMFFDGEVYVGDDGVKTVSKLPTREEAIGQLGRPDPVPRQANYRRALKGPAGTLGRSSRHWKKRRKPPSGAAA